MPQIFVSHAPQDTACAEQIRQGLEAGGHTTWREPTTLSIESILYPRMIENVILSSAAIVLVWSSSAAQSDWVERHLLFAQQLQKPILPVLLDGTTLPNTLVGVTPIDGHTSCADAAAQLLPLLPPPTSEDPLLKLAEQAAHQYIRERKEAIDAAFAMLQRGEHREAVLAILEYLAHNDLMDGVREKAREALHRIRSRRRHRPHSQMQRIPVIPLACAARTVTSATLTGAMSAPPTQNSRARPGRARVRSWTNCSSSVKRAA